MRPNFLTTLSISSSFPQNEITIKIIDNLTFLIHVQVFPRNPLDRMEAEVACNFHTQQISFTVFQVNENFFVLLLLLLANEIFNEEIFCFKDGYMSSPERGTRAYEEPYYTQYGTRGSSVTPIIDEEQG